MDVILVPFINVLILVINLYLYIIFGSVIISWLIAFNLLNVNSPIVSQILSFFKKVTEPAYSRIRKVVPSLGPIDISPMILIFGCIFLQQVLARIAMRF